MRNEVKKAAFDFEKYSVLEFMFKNPIVDIGGLSLKFDPKGTYNPQTGIFNMTLEFSTFWGENNENEMINLKIEAVFKFNNAPENINELPQYFYKNSIAIVFPYLRAFVSTLTLQANVKPVIMPLYNLSDLEQQFKDNTRLEESKS